MFRSAFFTAAVGLIPAAAILFSDFIWSYQTKTPYLFMHPSLYHGDRWICLFYQISSKWQRMSVYRVILLQHWTSLIQPIYYAVFCTLLKAISISYRYYYHFITSTYGKTCVWVFVFMVFQNIRKKLVVMLSLGLKRIMLSFLLMFFSNLQSILRKKTPHHVTRAVARWGD